MVTKEDKCLNSMEKYITEKLKYSNMSLNLLELLTIANQSESNVTINELPPEALEEECDHKLWGVEITVSLLLSSEGYGKNELFLFEDEENKNNFYDYCKKIIST